MNATRILCLHGYHGSADLLRRQIAPVASALPADVDLVFVPDDSAITTRIAGFVAHHHKVTTPE